LRGVLTTPHQGNEHAKEESKEEAACKVDWAHREAKGGGEDVEDPYSYYLIVDGDGFDPSKEELDPCGDGGVGNDGENEDEQYSECHYSH
jgi:hypothetical protein